MDDGVVREAETEWKRKRKEQVVGEEEGERDGSTQQRATGGKSHNEPNKHSVSSSDPSAAKVLASNQSRHRFSIVAYWPGSA